MINYSLMILSDNMIVVVFLNLSIVLMSLIQSDNWHIELKMIPCNHK